MYLRIYLLQVTNLEALGTGNKRYKCRISDDSSSMEAVLGSEAAKLAAEGSLQEGGVLSAQDYVLNIINSVQKLFITCKPCASSAFLLALPHITRPWRRQCDKGRVLPGNVRIHHHLCTVIEAKETAVSDLDLDWSEPMKAEKACAVKTVQLGA